ncbi:hypothetical protein ACUW58_002403 [Staphylococcus saprophyticus]
MGFETGGGQERNRLPHVGEQASRFETNSI